MPELERTEHDDSVAAGEALVLDGVRGGDERATPEPERSYAGCRGRCGCEDRALVLDGPVADDRVDGDLERQAAVAHLEHPADEVDVRVGEAAVASIPTPATHLEAPMGTVILIGTVAVLVAIVGCFVIWRMDAARAVEVDHQAPPAPRPVGLEQPASPEPPRSLDS